MYANTVCIHVGTLLCVHVHILYVLACTTILCMQYSVSIKDLCIAFMYCTELFYMQKILNCDTIIDQFITTAHVIAALMLMH